jgi:hypothetical protein
MFCSQHQRSSLLRRFVRLTFVHYQLLFAYGATTARWGGPEIPATVSKLVKNGDTYELLPFPDEKLNDIANPKGLKAVLGFEIDRNDVMWILDQGHIAGQPSAPGAEKLVLWDIKASKEIQRYEFPAEVADKTCSFLNDIVSIMIPVLRTSRIPESIAIPSMAVSSSMT